mmetsp:Transcript_32737/g.109285  ORF Transcript_32737/g.109285 Transcript_32737/m.109285 type:complete len:168 (-) Transcript_32737:211-714(-)
MLHVVPPMRAPRCVRESPLADATGFVAVEHDTLRHVDFANVFAAGDCVSAPNAKTMAAARKQAPVVVHNLLQDLTPAAARPTEAVYDGYGACPLTVEKGKVVLAEFGWGGQLMPSFPGWLIKNTAPSRLAWAFKRHALPWFYWHVMLPGRSWCDPMSWPSVREKGER